MRTGAVLLLLAWPAMAPADAVRDSLAACVRTIEAREPPPVSAPAEEEPAPRWLMLTESCPGVAEALEASEYAGWLPRDWSSEKTTLGQLQELSRLLATADTDTAATAPDTRGVTGVLKKLSEQEAREDRSLWERFVLWLRQRMSSGGGGDDTPAWLREFLAKFKVSGGGGVDLTSLLLGLVVVAALALIANELRAAGVFRGRRGRKGALAPAAARAAAMPAGARMDVDSADLRLQPSLLLNLLLEKLSVGQPAAGDVSLTHRQLEAAVKLHSVEQQTDFSSLAGCAERARYAANTPAEGELTAAVAAGRRLLNGVSPA